MSDNDRPHKEDFSFSAQVPHSATSPIVNSDERLEHNIEYFQNSQGVKFSILIFSHNPDSLEPGTLERIGLLKEFGGETIVVSSKLWRKPDSVDQFIYAPESGRATGWDLAGEACKNDIFVMADEYSVPSPRQLDAAFRRLLTGHTTAVVGKSVVSVDSQRDLAYKIAITGILESNHKKKDLSWIDKDRQTVDVLVIRRDDFVRIGGFQEEADGFGDMLRLCLKLEHIIGGQIVLDHELGSVVPSRRGPQKLSTETRQRSLIRGSLTKQFPQSHLGFPRLGSRRSVLWLLIIWTAFYIAGSRSLWSVIVVALATIWVASLLKSLIIAKRLNTDLSRLQGLNSALKASVIRPYLAWSYLVNFSQGYFGPDLGRVSPPRIVEKPLHVLFLNWRDTTHPSAGGAENYAHHLAKRMVTQGMQVTFLTQRHHDARRRDVIDGIAHLRCGGSLTQYFLIPLKYLLSLRKDVDVIVDCENGIPFFAPLFSRKPIILVVHHVHQEIFKKHLPVAVQWLPLVLEGRLMPWAYRHSAVVAVSNDTKQNLIQLGFDAEQIDIVTNGVIMPEGWIPRRDETPTILCMGRLTQQKSIDVLIHAIPKLLERMGNLRVDIIGQGPDRRRLEKLVWELDLGQHVRFHGYLSHRRRDEIASRAWAAVCPSEYEGWGVVCMEYSARGLAVVASNVPGLRESVQDGVNGYLFDYGNSSVLADKLQQILTSPQLRHNMEESGRAWAALHSWDASASNFAAIIKRIRHESRLGKHSDSIIDLMAHSDATRSSASDQFGTSISSHLDAS
jgi:glycosyltransferase involved in cell wall biosynthesis